MGQHSMFLGSVLIAYLLALSEALLQETGSGLRSDGISLIQRGTSSEPTKEWSHYISTFGRKYAHGTKEYSKRHELFKHRLGLIQAQNNRTERLWTAGVSYLTDRTDRELAMLRGWRRVAKTDEGDDGFTAFIAESAERLTAPSEQVDWKHLSMAARVPDQGECGSCWAVATASMLQGRYEAHASTAAGVNRSFSIQELVDCVPNPRSCGGSGGCDGATVELAMQYVLDNGLADATGRPYIGRHQDKPKCASVQPAPSFLSVAAGLSIESRTGASVGLKQWHKLPENRALPLMRALMEGPVAISVAASAWYLYNRGIYDGCSRDSVIDHAVTLFGYGIDKNTKYWTIRNSWGSEWGEQGFIRLLRHNTTEADDKFCGTDHDPKEGVACKPYPESAKVCGMCGMLYDSVVAQFM